MKDKRQARPQLFIGSSQEGLSVAECIQVGLDHDIDCKIWSQGVFGLSESAMDSLLNATRQFDFAVVVLTPDDLSDTRGVSRHCPRDNVVFELGLFMGAFGPKRTFIVAPRDKQIDLPSDLAGITTATYAMREDSDLQAALGSACTILKRTIGRMHGVPNQEPTKSSGVCNEKQRVARRRRRRSLGTAHASLSKTSHRLVNISTTGALIETDGELKIGTLLDLTLELEDGARAKVSARVVRVQSPDWGRVGGVAVAFSELAKDARVIIENYVDADHVAA